MADIEAIKARAVAASPGPWHWSGNVDYPAHVALSRWPRRDEKDACGLTHVMTFRRWGMQGAGPLFTVNGWMKRADEFPIFEVALTALGRLDPRVYRADIVGIRHPDAEFIAHARQDVDDLLAEVDRLRSELEAVRG